jgi:hypothetical protein
LRRGPSQKRVANILSGAIVWRWTLHNPVFAQPVVADVRLYVGDWTNEGSKLYAFGVPQ